VPSAALNGLRRDAVHGAGGLTRGRAASGRREVPVQSSRRHPTPTIHLSYLANVYNHRARDFYARHGVRVIEPAYESHEVTGEASLMITRHCVRYSLSLCPKQAKGVTGVQGTLRADPLVLQSGDEMMTLRFDCKACEMHVVGRIRPNVLQQANEAPLRFYRSAARSA
jgi:hypothetical protein